MTEDAFTCLDVRLGFIHLDCFLSSDRDAVLSLAIHDTDDGLGIAIRLSREHARALANYINRVLA